MHLNSQRFCTKLSKSLFIQWWPKAATILVDLRTNVPHCAIFSIPKIISAATSHIKVSPCLGLITGAHVFRVRYLCLTLALIPLVGASLCTLVLFHVAFSQPMSWIVALESH